MISGIDARPAPAIALTLCLFAGVILPASLSATQVCTTHTLGAEEFKGISGSADDNVIAVGKKGTIALWDGAGWVPMASPTTEELRDVEVVDANTAFAVGKKGETLRLSGGVWVQDTGITNEDLEGVWAASASEVWAVGKKGTVLYYDGAIWSDQSTAAGTGNETLTDAWGDADNFYALGDRGDLYRYDRVAGGWAAPDSLCQGGGGFEDLWGDTLGKLYLVKKKEVYLHDGTSCSVVANASENLEGVYGWSRTGEVYAVGKKGNVLYFDGSTWSETTEASEDLRDDWVAATGNAYYTGKKGELVTCQCIDCVIPKFVISHDSYGIHCQAETLRVDVIDAISGTPILDYNNTVRLDTQTLRGSWSRISGTGNFNDTVLNDGRAEYAWPMGESFAVFALSYTEGPPVFDVDVYDVIDPGTRDDDSEGVLEFSASGFTLTAAPLTNPPPALVTPFASPQVAGTDFAVFIAAYGQTPGDPQCGIIETYTGARDVKFWTSYMDPLTGSVSMSIDGGAIAGAEPLASAQTVSFVAGQAVVTGKYKDVGRIQLLVKDDTVVHPDLPNGIRGATAGFVVRPASFLLSNIEDGAGNPNPGAADGSGPIFTAAGQPFSVTVTALDAQGDPTPNYGQELAPETVALSTTLVAPAGGRNPPLDAVAGFGAFTGGSATAADFSWPEVGIVALLPSVGDGNYLTAGDVIGNASGNVGRFIPDHFAAALNAPQLDTACDVGAFTYVGQDFSYTVPPLITLTAQAAGGTATENYTASFFKLANSALLNRNYVAASGTLDTGGLPAPASDPVIVDLGAGLASLTFDAGSGLRFDRAAPTAPFDADIELSIEVFDLDNVAAPGNPLTFGSPGGIAFDSGRAMRYGRVRVANALGSELVDLGAPMRAEYFVDATTGFATHADDGCTGGVILGLGNFTANLAAGETCVQDTGAPGASGAGCAAPGPLGERFNNPPLAAEFNLFLAAPGAGNNGSVTVTADVPDWLEFDWDSSIAGTEDPAGTLTFGIFAGNARRIYVREVY